MYTWKKSSRQVGLTSVQNSLLNRVRNCRAVYPTVHQLCLWFLWFNQLSLRKLEINKTKKTFLSYFFPCPLFCLFLTHGEFFDSFHWKKFRLKTVCLKFQRLIIEQLARRSCFLLRPVCLLLASERFWESCELLRYEEYWLSFGVSWRLK